MASTPKSSRSNQYLKEREDGFDLDFGVRSKLPGYNALRDQNMRHYFENSVVQEHLWKSGQIDRTGRVIDLEKNKSKLHIIEREFKNAEKAELSRQKDEEEMRQRVQLERLRRLENARKAEKVLRAKESGRLQNEIVCASREAMGITSQLFRSKN
mmetsp:Transcript_6808/g.8382  ORF Transcript_6808/g.8382 Transcript_6808/m.8382 type:complete len:155 (-) Transcript_6808:4-468(-)